MCVFKQQKVAHRSEIRSQIQTNVCESVKKWWMRRDMTIAAVTALVVFMVLLGIVIYYKENDKDNVSDGNAVDLSYGSQKDPFCCGFPVYENILRCQNCKSIDELVEAIQNATPNHTILNLEIDGLSFLNHSISRGWLSKLNRIVQKINVHDIRYLEEGAFSGYPFEGLQKVTFSNAVIKNLNRNVFNESADITELEFQCSELGLQLERGAFDGLLNSLQCLQLQRCLNSPEALANITGAGPSATKSTRIFKLDLRDNILAKIGMNYFANTPFLQELYMSNSAIEEIDRDAFRTNFQLKKIDLTMNNLVTLPFGVFNNFNCSFLTNLSINICNNKWRCDCQLSWLKSFCDGALSKSFNCSSHGNRLAAEVDFCPKPTTTVPSSTTTALTTTTTSRTTPYPLVPVRCIQYNEQPINHQMYLKSESFSMEFFQQGDLPSYKLYINGDVTGHDLFWTNTRTKCTDCFTIGSNHLIVERLDYDTTYQFCMIKRGENTVSPFDCSILNVPPEWGSRAWLPNNVKIISIASLSALFLITIVITAFLVFFWIRQHPKVIRGNKRVVVAKSQTVDAIILPKRHTRKRTTKAQSFNSHSDGYLTPSSAIYSEPREEVMKIPHLKLGKPPPLPPNHPMQKRQPVYAIS